LVLLGTNDYREASVALGRACGLDPDDEDNCYLQARSLFVLGQYDEAARPFDKAMRAAPPANQANVHRAAALNFVELGMTQEAERHFRDAIRLYRASTAQPQPDPRLDYGAFLIRQGRTQSALELLQESVTASPGFSRPRRTREGVARTGPSAEALPSSRVPSISTLPLGGEITAGQSVSETGRTEEGERELRLGREGWNKQDYGSSKVK
jgi:tetratricopeptide (TPR) repeat protein